MYARFAGSVFGSADVSRLRFSGTGATVIHAGGNSGIPGCHQCGASRVTSGGRGPCMMAAFTASRHFMATLGAPLPRRSERNVNCSPTRVASSTRCCRRAVAVLTHSLLEDRVRAQHLMHGCAPTRMSEAAASSLTAVHMIITDNKQLGKRCKQFEQIAEA